MANKKLRSKVSRNKPESFRRIPKLRSCKKDLFEPVHEQDRRALYQLINNSHLIAGSEQCLDINRIEMVQNDRLLEKFWEKKEDTMIDLGMSGKRVLTETFAYIIRKNITASCSDGVEVDPTQPNILGNSLMGLHLFKHLDMCIQSYKKTVSSTNRFQVIMCKILLGRAKSVPVQKHGSLPLEPTPGYHSHVCCHSAKPTDIIDEAIDKSQVYLYEYDDNGVPAISPRHCLPYAVITCKYRRESRQCKEKARREINRIATVKPCLDNSTRNQRYPKKNDSPDVRHDAKRDTTSVYGDRELCSQVSCEQQWAYNPYSLAAYQNAQTSLSANQPAQPWPFYWNQEPYQYWPRSVTRYMPFNTKDPRTVYKTSYCAQSQTPTTNVAYSLPPHAPLSSNAVPYGTTQSSDTNMVYSLASHAMQHPSLQALATNALHSIPASHAMQQSLQTPSIGDVLSLPIHPLQRYIPAQSTGALHAIPSHALQGYLPASSTGAVHSLTTRTTPPVSIGRNSFEENTVPSLYNALVLTHREDNSVYNMDPRDTSTQNMKDNSRENVDCSQELIGDNAKHVLISADKEISDKNKQTSEDRPTKQLQAKKDKSSDKTPVKWILKPIDICSNNNKTGSRVTYLTNKTSDTNNDTSRRQTNSEIKSKDLTITQRPERHDITAQNASRGSKTHPSETLKPATYNTRDHIKQKENTRDHIKQNENTRNHIKQNEKYSNVKHSNATITTNAVSRPTKEHNPDQTSGLTSLSNKYNENKNDGNADVVKVAGLQKKSVVESVLEKVSTAQENLQMVTPGNKEMSTKLSRPSVNCENSNSRNDSITNNSVPKAAVGSVQKQLELSRQELTSVQKDQNHNKLAETAEQSIVENDRKEISSRKEQTENKEAVKGAKLASSVPERNKLQSDVFTFFSPKGVRDRHKSISTENIFLDAKDQDNRCAQRKVTRVSNASRSRHNVKSLKNKQLEENESVNLRQQYVKERPKDGGNKLSESTVHGKLNHVPVSSVSNDEDTDSSHGQLKNTPQPKQNNVNFKDSMKSLASKEPLRSSITNTTDENSIEQSIFEAVSRLANFDDKKNGKEENALFSYNDETIKDDSDERHHSGSDVADENIRQPDEDCLRDRLSEKRIYDNEKKNSTESLNDIGNNKEANATNNKTSLISFWKKIQKMYNISFREGSVNDSDNLVGRCQSNPNTSNSQSRDRGTKSQDSPAQYHSNSFDVNTQTSKFAKNNKTKTNRKSTAEHKNEIPTFEDNSSRKKERHVTKDSVEKDVNAGDNLSSEIDRSCTPFGNCSVTSGTECSWPIIEETDQNQINEGSMSTQIYNEDNSFHRPCDDDNLDYHSIPDFSNQSESDISDKEINQTRTNDVVEIWSGYCYPPMKIEVSQDSVMTLETFKQFDRKVFAMYNDFTSKYKKWCRLGRASMQNDDNSQQTLHKQINELELKVACLHINIESCVLFIESQMPQCEMPFSKWQQTNLDVISRHIEVLESSQQLDVADNMRKQRLADLIVQIEWVKNVDIVPKLPLDSPGNNLPSLLQVMNDKKILSSIYLFKKLQILSKLHKRLQSRLTY